MDYKIRKFHPDLDRDIILEYNARANFACEGVDVKEKGYDAFRSSWLETENAERLWDLVLDTVRYERNVNVIIEDENNQAIGFFWTMIDEISPGEFCMQINDIYVEEQYRKHGIAYDMFCYAQEHAKKHNIRVIRSGTGSTNTKSMALHEKFGFSVRRYEYEKLL